MYITAQPSLSNRGTKVMVAPMNDLVPDLDVQRRGERRGAQTLFRPSFKFQDLVFRASLVIVPSHVAAFFALSTSAERAATIDLSSPHPQTVRFSNQQQLGTFAFQSARQASSIVEQSSKSAATSTHATTPSTLNTVTWRRCSLPGSRPCATRSSGAMGTSKAEVCCSHGTSRSCMVWQCPRLRAL